MGGANPTFCTQRTPAAAAQACQPTGPCSWRLRLLSASAWEGWPHQRGSRCRSAQRPRHALPAADGNSRPPGQLPFPNTSSPDVIRPLPALYLASESAPSSRTLDLGGLPAWRVPAAAPGRGRRGWGEGGGGQQRE